MPAYNAGKYIDEAICSVLNQQFSDFELIVINDGSTDDTEKKVRSFHDPRIRLCNQPHYGIAAALNKGLQMAGAPLVARFDADDLCYPNRLQVQYELMLKNEDIILCGTAVDYIDEEGQFVFSSKPAALVQDQIERLVNKSCPFIHSSVIYRKNFILACGGYNPHAHSFEDHLLWTRVISRGRCMNLREPLIRVRLNQQSITIDEKWRTRAFRSIKKKALASGTISEAEGACLLNILKKQDVSKIREGSYHALLAKKYLWNNFQPGKARTNIRRALAYNPFYTTGYGLWLATWFPEKLVSRLYKQIKAFE